MGIRRETSRCPHVSHFFLGTEMRKIFRKHLFNRDAYTRENVMKRRHDIVKEHSQWKLFFGEYRRLLAVHTRRILPAWETLHEADREVFLSVCSWLLENHTTATRDQFVEVYNADLAYLGWKWGPRHCSDRKLSPELYPVMMINTPIDELFHGLKSFLENHPV